MMVSYCSGDKLCHELDEGRSHHSRKMVNDSNIARRLADVLVVRIIAIACSSFVSTARWCQRTSLLLCCNRTLLTSPLVRLALLQQRLGDEDVILRRDGCGCHCGVRCERIVPSKSKCKSSLRILFDSSSGDASVWGALSLAETLASVPPRTTAVQLSIGPGRLEMSCRYG